MLASCNSFASTPAIIPTNIKETATSVVTTKGSETQTVIPTVTLSPTPTLGFPIISRDNVSQISEIGRWQTNPSLKVIWNDSSTEIAIPELFDIVTVYDVNSFQYKQISYNEYKQLNPILFTDETAEKGNCSQSSVGDIHIISPDKTILVTGWSYGHKQPQKTVINLWDLAEKKCILQLPEYDGALTALAFIPSGNYLIFSTDWSTYVWNVKKSEITCQVNHAWGAIVYPAEKDVVVLSDGLNQTGGLSGLWNVEKCEKIQEYPFSINNPVFSSNGELLVGTKDNRILISDAKTGELLKEIDLPLNTYLDLSFSPDGRYLLLWDYGLIGTENNKNKFVLWAVKP
jgi:hypothetical protein